MAPFLSYLILLLFSFFCPLSTLLQNDGPTIYQVNSSMYKSPTSVVLSPGQALKLLCVFPSLTSSLDNMQIGVMEWKVTSFDESNRYNLLTSISDSLNVVYSNETTALLIVQSVTLAHSGLYQCHCRGRAQIISVFVVAVTGSEVAVETEQKRLPVWKSFYDHRVTLSNDISVHCTCDMDPLLVHKASITWSGPLGNYDAISVQDEPQPGRIRSNLTLSLNDLNPRVITNHTCLCGFGGSTGMTAQTVVKAAPLFQPVPSPRKSSEGESVKLQCRVVANPPMQPQSVQWTKLNSALLDNVKTESDPETGDYTLTIENVREDNRGLYICTAQNSVNSSHYWQGLRVRGRWASVWPFLGIAFEVIIIFTIIVFYERKRCQPSASTIQNPATSNSFQVDHATPLKENFTSSPNRSCYEAPTKSSMEDFHNAPTMLRPESENPLSPSPSHRKVTQRTSKEEDMPVYENLSSLEEDNFRQRITSYHSPAHMNAFSPVSERKSGNLSSKSNGANRQVIS